MDGCTLLHDVLDRRASLSPNVVAVRRNDTEWTYAELCRMSHVYAAGLHAQGVGRGDRVLICEPHAAETVAMLFAASRLGAMYVVANDGVPDSVLEHVIRDSEPAVVVGDRLTRQVAHRLGLPATDLTPPGEMSRVCAGPPPCLSVDPVSLIYTSGSTSRPKAVVSTHAQVLFPANAIQSQLRYETGDVVFCCLPLSFDYGLYQVFLSCIAGATLHLGDAQDAGPALPNTLRRHGVTVLPAVPSLASSLVQMLSRGARPPERLRLVTSTGAHLPDVLADRLRALVPGVSVLAMFGLTECKRVSIMPRDAHAEHPGSAGRALPDTELYVVDDCGRRLPPGEVGQLVVRGPHVMAGYWRAPALTAQRFGRDEFGQPLLFTGDQCTVDADGFLYFLGRTDDIYKQRGFRVSAVEVEAASMDVPGVVHAAVLPPYESAGAVLVVSGRVTGGEVVEGLRLHLESHKIPDTCVVLDTLPLAPSGKADKKLLNRMLRSRPGAAGMRIVP